MDPAPDSLYPSNCDESSTSGGRATPSRSQQSISAWIGSSSFSVRTDDTLKDEDNVSWVMDLEPQTRQQWALTLQWIRMPDRLLEHETFDDSHEAHYTFSSFIEAYMLMRSAGTLPEDSPFKPLLSFIADRWHRERLSSAELQVWDLYLSSLRKFANPSFRIQDISEYRAALYGLSGTLFQTLPYLPRHLFHEVGVLGTVDQFYNNLRDLSEDHERGLCYFPDDLLDRFCISRSSVLTMHRPTDAFVQMIDWLLYSFMSQLNSEMAPLLTATDLHPSWHAMLRNVMLRRHRIVYWFKACGYNPRTFAATYWQQVRRDLALRQQETEPTR